MKLNVLLAITDQLRISYKNMVEDFEKFFSNSQGAFLGEKNTYEPRQGALDEPGKKKHTLVITTVDEKFDWFLEHSKDFIDALFSQERTNSMGLAKAKLVVEGVEWGEFTSLELLRLKSLLENSDLGKLEKMLSVIPVRSDAQIWEPTTVEAYTKRAVFQTPLIEGVAKTTEKIEFVLEDPNLKFGVPNNYVPKTSVKNVPTEVADYTQQKFSGEWSQRQRAEALKRRSLLLTATIKALKECNDCEAVSSELTANRIFKYLFKGN